MARTELYINGKLADFNELDLSFVYSVEDDDTLSVSGSHSKRSIKLPATKRNNDIFSNALQLQQPPNLNSGLYALPSRILVDGIPVFIGTAQIDKGGISKLGSYFEVLFLSDNSNWIEEMRDVGMDSIEMHDARPIDYTGQNVVFFYSAYNSYDGFCFFLPKTAKWRTVGNVRTDEFYPAIFIDYIFRKSFSNIGYTIKSDFFDTDLWRGLIVPVLQRNYDTKYLLSRTRTEMSIPQFTGYIGYYYPTYIPIYFVSVNQNNGQQLDVFRYNVGGTNYSHHLFHPRVNGKFRFQTFIYDANTSQRQSVHLVVNGVVQRQIQPPTTTTSQINYYQELDLKIGDVVAFNGIFTSVPALATAKVDIQYLGLVSTSNVPNVTIGNYYPFNAIYELNQLCSKWKILDIIADIQKVFNLVFVTDTNKKEVTIEPRDYWQAVAAGANWNGNGLYTDNKDITQKVDISKDIEFEFNPDSERYLTIKYNDKDPTVKDYEEEREGLGLYSHKFYRGQRFKEGEKEIKLSFFNKCFHIIDSEINPSTTDPKHFYQLPLLFSDSWYNNKNPEFPNYDNDRAYLLWFYGNYAEPVNPNEGATGIQIYDPITQFRQRKGFPLAWMVLYNDYKNYSDLTANLSFSKEGYTHSLITNFHQRNLERQAQNITANAYIRWSNIDIFNLDFKLKYVINQVPYILKTVDGYNPNTGSSTKTVLQLDSRLMADNDNLTNTNSIDSDLKGLIII
jgi:hypothetical protein